jgi:hypothetical protein
MKKRSNLAVIVLALLLFGCTSSPEGTTTVADAANPDSAGDLAVTPSEISAPTSTSAPTNTSAPTVTSTNTALPSPTQDPVLGFLGTWSCPECYRQQTIEIYDAGDGLQYLIYRDGDVIEWIGPDDCKNIYIPYSECNVVLSAGGKLTISFVQPVGGGCTQRFEQDLVFTGGQLDRVRYESWNYCDGELTLHQDLLADFGPWGPYSRVE